jgi:hypothetical protein
MRALLVLHLHADHCCAMMPGRENNRGTFDFVSAVRRYFFTPNSQAQRALHTVLHVYRLPSVRGVFFSTPGPSFFFTNVPSSPHTSSYMFGHHPATVRLAGRKRRARLESSEALAEQPAVARTAVELHGCCARVSLAEALLTANMLTAVRDQGG